MKKVKKKKRRRRELVLEEDDYELLEENTGIRRARPAQHRRIKKARDIGSTHETAADLEEQLFGKEDEDLEDDVDDVVPGSGRPTGNSLDDDLAPAGRPGGRRDERERDDMLVTAGGELDDDQFDEDDDGWLVHEDEEEGGPPGERRRRRRAIMQSMPGVDADAMEEAQDIFGDVTDLLALYESRKRDAAEGLEPDEYEGLEEEDLSDEEAAEELRMRREERRRAATARRMQEQLDPEAMARHFMLPTDEKIRDTDLPEREQLHRGPDPQDFDLQACSQWVIDHLVGDASQRGVVRETLEDGALEVEGPPPPWYGSRHWHHRDLKEAPHAELQGQRGFYLGRDKEGRKSWRHNAAAQAALRGAVQAVLAELYHRHSEVPFIGMYRKEACGELLAVREEDEPEVTIRDEPNFPRGTIQARHRRSRRWDVLFGVQALAQRWRELQRRKEARQAAYERAAAAAEELAAAAEGGEGGASQQQVAVGMRKCLELLQEVQTPEALDDVEAKFQLAAAAPAGGDEVLSQLSLEDGPGGKRRPQKATPYHLCRKAGLGECVRGMVLPADQFAENVEATYKRAEPQDPQLPPEEYAAQFVREGAGFSSPDSVLRGAVLMAAAEISAEPAVRQYVRDLYWTMAVVSTSPTPAGETALDPFHLLGVTKRLRRKTLKSFEGTDLFLRVVQAERAGLIKVSMGVEEPQKTLLGNLRDLYTSDREVPLSRAWDEVRVRVLEEALTQHLLPALEREARAKLATQARMQVAQQAADKLWDFANQAPLQVRLVDEEDYVPDRRVMACVYGPGKPATTFVMLDPSGNMVDFLHCPQLSGHIARQRARAGEVYDMFSDPKKAQDAARIRSFIEDHKPHVIVMGASNPEARVLEADLKAIRDQILLDNPNFFIDLGTGDIATQMCDEGIAALWSTSAAAAEELPASPDIVRAAVALGRQMLDPLAVLAALCGPSKEILSLHLHPLQGQLPEGEQLAVVERVLSTAVAQAGVDLNAVASNAWMQAPLQFVPGLGPRKAAALLRAVMRAGGFVESRNQVWRELGVMGNRVFRNCGAFLRIRPAAKGMANLEMDPLDDTRVHPESYAHAVAIAQSAVAGGGDEAGDVAVENALARPQDVESLDLAAYNQHIESQEGGTNKLSTLIDIQQEFVMPFGELRREVVAPKEEEVFWLCSGQSPDTLRPGRKVEARVRFVTETDARCVLTDINGLEAVIHSNHVSSSAGEGIDCRDFLKAGQTVMARIRSIDPQRGLIELTTRSADLNDDLRWEEEYCQRGAGGDTSYHVPSAEEVRRQETERRRQQNKRNFIARPIRHPLFKNLSMHEAAAELLERTEVGEGMFRPHPKGPHMLALTLLLPDGVVQHVDIKEGAKGGAAGSHLALGSPLTVEIVPSKKSEKYDDLDELAARYLDPVRDLLQKLAAHRKFRLGSWEVLQDQLRTEKQRNDPRMAAYLLAADTSKPGLFFLGFIVSANPHREYFTVTPEGYHFRQKDYDSVDRLIAEWKKRPYGTKPVQQAAAGGAYAQQSQAVAAAGGQYDYSQGQYAQYPGAAEQGYHGYAATTAAGYGEAGEFGGAYGGAWNGGAYGAGEQQAYGAGYVAQQQYGQYEVQQQQQWGAEVPPPPPPPQQHTGPSQQWPSYQGVQ